MKTGPFITSVEYTAYEFTAHNLGKDYNTFNMVYEPDGRLTQSGGIIQIHTDQGITGEYPIAGGPTREQVAMGAQYLVGKDVTARGEDLQRLETRPPPLRHDRRRRDRYLPVGHSRQNLR